MVKTRRREPLPALLVKNRQKWLARFQQSSGVLGRVPIHHPTAPWQPR